MTEPGNTSTSETVRTVGQIGRECSTGDGRTLGDAVQALRLSAEALEHFSRGRSRVEVTVYLDGLAAWMGAVNTQNHDGVTLTPAIRTERRIGSKSGALVVGITSPQIESVTGLREGDVILSVGRRPIRSAEELSTLLRQIPARTRIQFVLERNGQRIATKEFVLG